MIPSASFDREFAVSYSIDLGVDPDATTSLIKKTSVRVHAVHSI